MGGGWSTSRPGRFTPRKDPVPILQMAGWTPRPDWTGGENHASAVIGFPYRPARSESLYRLSYPCPLQGRNEKKNCVNGDSRLAASHNEPVFPCRVPQNSVTASQYAEFFCSVCTHTNTHVCVCLCVCMCVVCVCVCVCVWCVCVFVCVCGVCVCV